MKGSQVYKSPTLDELFSIKAEALGLAPPKIPAVTLYLIAAYSLNGKYWKIHRNTNRDEHETRADAEAAAAQLKGEWAKRTIIRVDLPGEE